MSRQRQAQHRLGPQRNPAIDEAVLQATRDLLVENGYAGTSIDAIATRG
ncbi:TetR family transcriptional regulator, partial [Rhodococcus hoagii]|nr:TetR family transcriptional regulator [Prescottella equi]